MTKREQQRVVCGSWPINVGPNKFINAIYADGAEVSWLVESSEGETSLEAHEAKLIAEIKSRQIRLIRLRGLIEARKVSQAKG